MLESAIAQQLKGVFTRLEGQVELVAKSSSHEKQEELLTMLRDVAETSEKIGFRLLEENADAPWFRIELEGNPTGISFRGIPGGHEFTSLILAVLNADQKGKLPDQAFQARIRALKGPVSLRTFVSLSCENCPEVVQSLNLMAVFHPDFSHEMTDGAYAQEEIQRLGIGGVPAVFLGDEMIHSGKSDLSELLEKLEDRLGIHEDANLEEIDLGEVDVAVVGGGPAGVSAAIYTARKGLSTVLISDRIGGQVKDTLGIENFISVPYTEGPKLSAALAEHLSKYEIKVLEHRKVEQVEALERGVALRLKGRENLKAKSLVVATGAKWRELGIEGEKEYLGRGVAFCPTCDGPFYKGKEVVVVGGGNSGVEAAIDLAGIVKKVTVVEFLPELKADQVLVEKLTSLPNTAVIKNARTSKVLGDGAKVTGISFEDRATEEEHQLDTDGVFVQIGLVPNSRFVADLVETNRYGEIVVDDRCRTSAPAIFAAGDVTTVPYKQIVIAMGEGAKAGLAVFDAHMAEL